MAVISGAQWSVEWAEGTSARIETIALKNVTTGDTVDLASQFSRVKWAILGGTTVIGTGAGTVGGANNTVVTMPTGLANDSAVMMVFGCAA